MVNKKISLVLTSQDRVDALDRLIRSLLAQNIQIHIELIFINQGSYNPFASIEIPNFIDYKQIMSDRVSLSKARNLGVEIATGDIIGFPDDDCWYESGLLEKIIIFFEQYKDVDVLCTNVFDPDRNMAYGNRPVGIKKRINFHNLFILPISVGIFCRNNVLNLVGRNFDEALGAGTPFGSGEETELIVRFLEKKIHVEYDGNIQVFHPVSRYVEDDFLKFYRYGLGFGYLNAKVFLRGYFSVLPYFLEMLARSAIGLVFNINKPIARKVYWCRFCGILRGCAIGFSWASIPE